MELDFFDGKRHPPKTLVGWKTRVLASPCVTVTVLAGLHAQGTERRQRQLVAQTGAIQAVGC